MSALLGFSSTVIGLVGRFVGRFVGTGVGLFGTVICRLSDAVIDRLFGTVVNLANYKIYKIFKKNNKGYSLIEILIAMGILSILSGIAYVSYQGYTGSVHKKDLKLHGKLFASAVKNCITVRGSWNITPLKNNGIPNTDPNAKATPCKPGVKTDTQEVTKNKLKKILDFTCPADTKCTVHTHTYPQNRSKLKYTCLSIEKEVSGKTLQVISRVSYENPDNYEIWCNEVSTPLELENGRCRGGAPLQINALIKDCPGWR